MLNNWIVLFVFMKVIENPSFITVWKLPIKSKSLINAWPLHETLYNDELSSSFCIFLCMVVFFYYRVCHVWSQWETKLKILTIRSCSFKQAFKQVNKKNYKINVCICLVVCYKCKLSILVICRDFYRQAFIFAVPIPLLKLYFIILIILLA